MREECLREFGFADIYRQDKAAENAAALQVPPRPLAATRDTESDPLAPTMADPDARNTRTTHAPQ